MTVHPGRVSNPGEFSMRNIVFLALLAASMAISACNTVAGAGKDVTTAGHAVTDTAEDAKHP